MSEQEESPAVPQPVPPRPRPVLLTVTCLFAFTWFALLALLSILFALKGERIAFTRNLYLPGDNATTTGVIALFITWFLLNAAGVAGTLLIWFLRRTGYFLVLFASLAALTFQFVQHSTVPGAAGVNIVLALLFTVFYKRFH
jgi:hypothetical protein